MDFKNIHIVSPDMDAETKIKILQDEINRLRGFENIVNGFMNHDSICLAIFQKYPVKAVFVNRGLEILTGYSREEIFNFTQSDYESIIQPELRDEFFERYRKRLEGYSLPDNFEFSLIRKDGAVLFIRAFIYLTQYNNEPSVVITLIDITQIKETEKALRNSRENYRLLFNRTPVSIFYFDKDLRISQFNDRFTELLQSSDEKLTGLDLHTLKDQSLLPCLESAINGKNGYFRGEYRATTSNARIVISMKTEPLQNDAGEITGGVGIIEDIKQVHEIEEALQKSEKNFKEMIDQSPLPITVTDAGDNIVYNNMMSIKLFAFFTKRITDLNTWWNYAYPDPLYRQKVIENWYAGYKNSQKNREIFGPREFKVTCGDGIVRDIEFNVIPVGDLSFIIMNDVTKHRRAEIELLKTKKIESLGILAGGIAHDFNNILTAIIGNLNLAKMDITADHKSYDLLNSVEKAAWRARDLTQQLLTFSMGGSPVKKITSIREMLVDSASFALTGTDIKPDFDIDDDLMDADIDEGQISQVIHNLVLNARESMTNGGVINISAGNCRPNDLWSLAPEKDYIRIKIKDQGIGISQAILPNIFDPFFTTKSTGTGLGLSVSYSIVKKHEGDIKVTSIEGTGTVFEVFLPASEEKCFPDNNQAAEENTTKGRILVMDDEELILDISKKMLTRMGYDVAVAKSGEETISLYKEAFESGSVFSCVIMDLTIPGGMGGKDTLDILKQYDPGVAAIVSSGYSNDPVMSEYKEYGFAGVSGKPYSFDDLRKEIERVISKNREIRS